MSYQYLCFLDVMGYKEYIQKDITEGKNIFKDKLISSFRVFEEVNAVDIRWKSISDSIFITVSKDHSVKEFLNLIHNIWLSFLKNGLLIRGGISYDDHFENNNITYSKVLVDAYYLENNIAFFPRIVIKDTVIEMEKEQGNIERLIEENIIIKSGYEYIIDVMKDENKKLLYDNLKKIYETHKKSIFSNANIRAKHLWLQEYLLYKFPDLEKYIVEWDN